MKKIKMKYMMRLGYITALIASVVVFNSCTESFMHQNSPKQTAGVFAYPQHDTIYGTYLAGRVAHLRQDFGSAANYYIKSVNLGSVKPEIIGRTYLLLTSEGRISEAAQYAAQAKANGDKSSFINFVLMTDFLQKNQLSDAHKSLDDIKDKVYQSSVIPLFKAWIYAGENKPDEALKTLEILQNDPSLKSLYYMHSGMINDYFGRSEDARKHFDTIVENENLELSYRSLQIISNFYIRHNAKEKAAALVKKYFEKNSNARMLGELYVDIINADPVSEQKLINSAQKGEAEAIFNIGTIFRGYQGDISQIFTALALYLNQEHDVAHISMADLFEQMQRLDKSAAEYEKITAKSPVYFMAQLKIASIYMMQKQNQKALQKLEDMLTQYPNDYQILFNLGEINRIMNRQAAAIKYYNKALNFIPESAKSDWTVYYALGMAYERNDQWQQAEEVLKKAVDVSNRHPFVLNYLGYTWLKHNKNANEALFMIFDAYRQNPEDGHIMDSLGWALYRMGRLEESIKVLERAAEYLPGNAIVCDHLGDAYWLVGRKDEARYQWQHALTLKEDAEELNKEEIRKKIADGLTTPAAVNFNEALLVERLKSLNLND